MLQITMSEAVETGAPSKIIFRAVTVPLPWHLVLALGWTDMGYAWRTGQYITVALLGITVNLYRMP